ncbi:HEPN domain-containing protein [Filimonas effusa]|uniref:HEPN domain-containing protein n=1 Tax=Filimonas effusa TaxID=2508721 RepID=A0A4Q1D9V5_9BACT|nr:HEPN domain-containing protein [Filimonas effusa]RXK86000.1 HEPN domain-containing protein [Filimonas effusa]
MRTTLEHLSFEQKNELTIIIKKIIAAIAVDQIICYGSRIKNNYHWSCSALDSCNKFYSSAAIDLLIIPAKQEARSSHDIIQAVTTYNTPALSIFCIVHHEPFVSDAIMQGHQFFVTLHKSGYQLYGNSRETIALKAKENSVQTRLQTAEFIWESIFRRAQDYLKGAGFYLQNNATNPTGFLLHQAIEQTAIALLRALTSYRPDSHNLSRLLPLMEHAGLCINNIFPQNTEQEKELFSILKRSYSDTRYTDDFHIPPATAQILYTRTDELMKQAKTIYLHETSKWREQIEKHDNPPLNIAYLNPLHNAS